MRIRSISDTFESIMIVFCMKKIVIVKFITLFCDRERLFESLEIK